ncbi:MAG: hypothetical protein E7185_09905 [Erysipelotrichaceae bacterium]|nr:hypothetical protein [Erysipelotrichaceae bacterium]
MSYKEIDIRQALDGIIGGQKVYVLVRLEEQATVLDLCAGKAYMLETDPAPKPEPKKKQTSAWPPKKDPKVIDHGKICACYKAGRSVAWIADDIGCSAQTVINHLKKEGIYKND